MDPFLSGQIQEQLQGSSTNLGSSPTRLNLLSTSFLSIRIDIYSHRRAVTMSHVLCRATVRFSPALRLRPSSPFSSHHQPFLRSRVPLTSVLGRSFSRSCSLKEEESDRKEEEQREKARQREQRKVTSGKSAQSLENDRPWHREGSHAQPKSTSPDPTHGDLTKGTLHCRCGFVPLLILTRLQAGS